MTGNVQQKRKVNIMMRTAVLLISLVATSSGAFAAPRSHALSPSWQDRFDGVTMNHSAIVRTGPNTFERVVRDQGQCDKGEELAPAGNTPGYYTCEEVDD